MMNTTTGTDITVVLPTVQVKGPRGQRCTGLILSDGDVIAFLYGTEQVALTDHMLDWLHAEFKLPTDRAVLAACLTQ